MQSSAMMAVRAAILLVCLAIVPMLAIFGRNLPAVVKSLLQNYTGNPAKTASSPAELTNPPVFRPGLLASTSRPEAQSGSPMMDSGASQAVVLPAKPLVPLATTAEMTSQPAGRPEFSPASQSSPASASLSPAGPATAAFPPGYFREAELRLRQLGATYYLLETLGPEVGQYRFFCKVALGSKPDETLAFFATDHDPLTAMEQVVRQVEGWRSHAQP